jgi:hypothetical protein
MADWYHANVLRPAEDDEGRVIHAVVGTPPYGFLITGTLLRGEMIDDEGECPEPVDMPDWIIATRRGEVSFHDVDLWRYGGPHTRM